MMDAWSTCNVTIVKTSSMWKKVLWSNFPPMYWLPMLVAFSFFCCCLILLWFCTLPALLVFVVLLAVLFCLILLLLVLPFSEFLVLFCFVLFFNFDDNSQRYFHKLFSVFLVLFCFVIFCYFFNFILLLFHNLTCFLGMSGSKKTYKPPVAVFFFLTWFYMARFGFFVLIRELGSKSLVLNQFLTNNSFYIDVHNVSEGYPIHTKRN